MIHTSAGVASLVTAIKLGPREGFDGLASRALAPHNLPMAATGAGLGRGRAGAGLGPGQTKKKWDPQMEIQFSRILKMFLY